LQSPPAALHSYANHEDVSITDEATIIKTGKQKKRNHAKWDANRKSTDKRMQSRYKNEKNDAKRKYSEKRIQSRAMNKSKHKGTEKRPMQRENSARNGWCQ